MQLNLLNEVVEATEDETAEFVSPHTGRTLREAEVILELPAEQGEVLAPHLDKLRREELPLSDAEGTEWLVRTFTYRQAATAQFLLGLEQHERLEATLVEFGPFSLEPVYYNEFMAGGQLGVLAEFDISAPAEELRSFIDRHLTNRGEPEYFEVIRHGVNDQPVPMRLGRCLWQQLDASTERHQLSFFHAGDDAEVEPRHPEGFEPMLANAAHLLAETTETVEALLDELAAANVLSAEAVTRIRSRAAKPNPRLRHGLRETDYLSDYRL